MKPLPPQHLPQANFKSSLIQDVSNTNNIITVFLVGELIAKHKNVLKEPQLTVNHLEPWRNKILSKKRVVGENRDPCIPWFK